MTDDDIITAIDERRFAVAKIELEKKTKRFPTRSFYKAAIAYCSLKSGQLSKATEEAISVSNGIPSDPKTLALLRTIFLLLNNVQKASEVYDNAIRKYSSPELLLTIFEDAVSSYDTKMILKSSQELVRISNGSASSLEKLALASLITSSDELETVHHLANTFENKFWDQGIQKTFLKARLLSNLRKYSEVINVLENYLQRNLELNLLYLDALFKAQEWDKLFEFCCFLLFEQKFDDYDTLKSLARSSFELSKPIEDIKSLISNNSRNNLLACIYLDEMYGLQNSQSLEQYYKQYKAKPCCFVDLSAFKLPEAFVNALIEERDSHLSKQKLERDEISNLINIEMFLSHLKIGSLEWNKFESYGSSSFAELYPLYLVQSLQKTDSSASNLITHIFQLESLVQQNPTDSMLKSWLLNLYAALGLSSLALDSYEDLKIKMVQHDTLSYKLQLNSSLSNLKYLIDIYRFYLTAEQEVNYFLQKAKDTGLYTKIGDIYLFGKKLNHSLSKHLLVVQILKHSRMLNNEHYNYFLTQVNDKKWEYFGGNFELFDNRDFTSDYSFGIEASTFKPCVFTTEQKQSKEYVQIQYAKELLFARLNQEDAAPILKLLDKWLGSPKYKNCLSATEFRMMKIYLSMIKVERGAQTKDLKEQTNFLVKQLDFRKLLSTLSVHMSPLSRDYTEMILALVEFEKMGRLFLAKKIQFAPLLKKFRADLDSYLSENARLSALKDIQKSLSTSVNEDEIVTSQWEKLADGLRRSEVQLF